MLALVLHSPTFFLNVCSVCVCVLGVQLRLKFHKQQEEIRRLREMLNQRDVRIKQLELEINNVRNSQDSH